MREREQLLDVEKIEIRHYEPGRRSGTSLLELLALLIQRRWAVLAPGLILAVATAAYVHFLPNTYTAEALILPPQQQPSSLAAFAAGSLGGLGAAGIASQIAMKSTADLYVGMLKSRTISDAVIGRFGLCEVYKTTRLSKARRLLRNQTTFASTKDSLLTISVKDHDPKRAAEMANAFIEELYKQNSRMVVTDASQRRQFFQKRLSQEKDDLAEAEKALKNTQAATGLIAPTGQAEVLLRSAGQIRAQISMRQVSLQAMRSYATDENAQVEVLKREIATLQSQLTQLENSGNAASGLEVSAGRLPAASLDYLRKARDVKFHETLFELLSKQYEAASLDEAREAPVIQVIDSASVPDTKSGPSRLTLIMEGGLGGCVLGALYVVIMHQAGALRRLLRQVSSVAPFAGSLPG